MAVRDVAAITLTPSGRDHHLMDIVLKIECFDSSYSLQVVHNMVKQENELRSESQPIPLALVLKTSAIRRERLTN